MSDFVNDMLQKKYQKASDAVDQAPLIQYLKKKTTSVRSSSKARGSFGNLYALYVLVEDYLANGSPDYQGMMFSKALERQRELPFGEKLQNHALNHRCNEEFHKFFPELNELPIIRNVNTKRYRINEQLLLADGRNIAQDVLDIVNRYVELKLEGFSKFFEDCVSYKDSYENDPDSAQDFVTGLLDANQDARIFEIVSFCLTKYDYYGKSVFYGDTRETVTEHAVQLYKTGRTNANDGGIDFIMIPEGRVFQVTETIDFKKYFLDIDKLNRFPITFVVKSELTPDEVKAQIEAQARIEYSDPEVLARYLACIQDVITIPTLTEFLETIISNQLLGLLLDELVVQCKVEYNLNDEEQE